MDTKKERRVKIIQLDENMLVDIFNWHRDPPDFLALPITDELPADCEVLRVWINHSARCLEAIVASEEFGEVADGCIPPIVNQPLLEYRTLRKVGNISETYQEIK
jgi:hypothetical protein